MRIFKTLTSMLIVAITMTSLAFASGLNYNSNQSASYVRMVARDASTEIDAVFYNPAGLTFLNEGLHISLSNQSIFQERIINNSYKFLNNPEYSSTNQTILFPNLQAAYKNGDFVYSIGYATIAGGGSVKFNKGLPSFELGIADLYPALMSKGVTKYSTDLAFEGFSADYSFQGGVSYKINKMLSAFAGARYVSARNTITGSLKNTTVYFGNSPVKAPDFFNGASVQYSTAAQKYTQAGDLAKAKLYADTAKMMGAEALLLADQEADVIQSGSGFTPILGANFSLMDSKLNIGLKYEFKTSISLENETAKDLLIGFTPTGEKVTQYPSGGKTNADIPAEFNLGVSYKIENNLLAAVGFHYCFDDGVDWGKNSYGQLKTIDKNYTEIAVGIEYGITDNFLVSAGWLQSISGASKDYQSDMNYSLNLGSVSFGGKYQVNQMIDINLGCFYSMYTTQEKDAFHNIGGDPTKPYSFTEKYDKKNVIVALGVDLHL